MKNPDRDDESPDGREIAERLYDGLTDTKHNTDSTDAPSEQTKSE